MTAISHKAKQDRCLPGGRPAVNGLSGLARGRPRDSPAVRQEGGRPGENGLRRRLLGSQKTGGGVHRQLGHRSVSLLHLAKAVVDGTPGKAVLNDPAEEVGVGALNLFSFGGNILREANIQLDGTRVPHEHWTPESGRLGFLFGFLTASSPYRTRSRRRPGPPFPAFWAGIYNRGPKGGSQGEAVLTRHLHKSLCNNELRKSILWVNHVFPEESTNLSMTESQWPKCQNDNDLYTLGECMTEWETETDFSQKTGAGTLPSGEAPSRPCQGSTERRNAPNAAPSNPRKLLRTSRAVFSRKMWAV